MVVAGFLQAGAVSDPHQRELEYHEKLYSGFAQSHFARPAVRALSDFSRVFMIPLQPFCYSTMKP